MTITIAGGGNPSGPTFPVQRSVRLRSSASAYFGRTLTTPTNNKIWTWSAWVKRGKASGASAAALHLFGTGSGSNDAGTTQIYFESESLILGGYSTPWLKSNAVYRDPSAWYHIVVAWDNSNATAANRAKLYVNGVEITYAIDNRASLSTTSTYGINQAVLHTIGAWSWNNGTFAQPEYYDGYLTEINFIDGQALTPTSFGAYNSYGVWSPSKYTGSYGTNGFYLNFQDNSGATATTIGKDSSGNGNNWTPNNISVTAGVTYDSMLDVPTNTSATNANFATLNPLRPTSSGGFSNGNLTGTAETGTQQGLCSTITLPWTGKWYAEVIFASNTFNMCGVTSVDKLAADINTVGQQSVLYYALNGNKFVNGTGTAYGATYTTETIGIAFDGVAGTVTFYKANVSQGAITLPSSTVNYVFCQLNAAGAAIAANWNFGQRPFTYTPPTGFIALNTYNLPAPTIPNGAAYMAASLYTGTGAALSVANTVNGVSFQPDFVWVKGRSGATDHALYDSVRGTTKQLESNTTTAETTEATGLTAFGTSGFTVGALAQMNTNTATYVGWQWKASNAAAVTNTSGSITSQVSANPSAGFSIVTYTGTGANATVGHGLGITPKMVIVKVRSGPLGWITYHANQAASPANGFMSLNLTLAYTADATVFNNTLPTSTTIALGNNVNVNNLTSTYVAYCFSEIAGYSKFGSYTGNGSTDGPFVYLGFRPRFILFKNTTAYNWQILDTSRATYNQGTVTLFPNLSDAENTTATQYDILSNGFKIRTSDAGSNGSGNAIIYACFAENPFNYSLAR
jgi:hypothetical protein